ncbi:sigma-54-dependent Fis family transcriptional regulator [Irregularibacter muris]|uniref:Sigma-54-dependent Fis family transcriptional regulator n=1 Tax=Irregularibacter muris TaxID=1796619 RepID=A0AAE3HFX7_9FIRM|nr:sigma-54-dependent Fis family transcriptional regulator [Irregularibacter muris]MCR1899426.1 sigma-54-dependent Fis family transcriptional regulator [Irregularibacter muris]
MKVKEVMTSNPITISGDSSLKDGAEIFSTRHIDTAPVVDENFRLLGIFTKKHLSQAIKKKKPPYTPIDEIMSTSVACVQEEQMIQEIFDKKEETIPVINKENKLVGILTKTDLLRVYHKKLEYAMKYINAVLYATNNGILIIDHRGKITLFNKAAEELLGLENHDAIGKSILEIMPDSRLPRTIETGEKEIGQTVLYKKKMLISNKVPVIYKGKIIGAVAIFKDMTDYNHLMEELDAEKDVSSILKTILEIAYDGIVVVDKEGYITMISKAYTNFLGVDQKEVIGKHVTEVIENTRMHKVIETGQAEIADTQNIKGSQMIASRIPIIKKGKVTGAVGKVMFRDVKDLTFLYKRISKMDEELARYKGDAKRAHSAYYSLDNIVGRSPAIMKAKNMAKKAAGTSSNVLLLGESGTGKELFAHAIHKGSARRNFPFVKVNCAAIPNELLESELFGYEGGAFTGAQKKGKIGKFEVADRGTIFLDEIGDMSLHMQAKLLRVLQEREIEKVGSTTTKKVDIRIIAATNRNLEELVKRGEFREDLFYRLDVVTLHIPPLRERNGDVQILAYYLIDKICNSMGKYILKLSEETMMYLENYQWPGNIRELENVLERAINIVEKDAIIQPMHLSKEIVGQFEFKEIRSLKDAMEETERNTLVEALSMAKGNRTKAARLLDISRTSFYEKLAKYNLKF